MREVIIDGEKITFIKVKTSTGKVFEIPTIYFEDCYFITVSTEPTKKED